MTGDGMFMSRRRAYLTVALLLLSLIPSGFGVWRAMAIKDEEPDRMYMTEWGRSKEAPDLIAVKTKGAYFRSHKSSYHLAVVCYPYFGVGDPIDVTDLHKSGLREITDGEIEITAALPRLVSGTAAVAQRLNFSLLLVPNGVEMNQFSSLRQAFRLGVVQLEIASGPA